MRFSSMLVKSPDPIRCAPAQRNGSQQRGGLRARVTAHLPNLAVEGTTEGSSQKQCLALKIADVKPAMRLRMP